MKLLIFQVITNTFVTNVNAYFNIPTAFFDDDNNFPQNSFINSHFHQDGLDHFHSVQDVYIHDLMTKNTHIYRKKSFLRKNKKKFEQLLAKGNQAIIDLKPEGKKAWKKKKEKEKEKRVFWEP